MNFIGGCKVLGSIAPTFEGNEGFRSVVRVAAGKFELTLDEAFASRELNVVASPGEFGNISLVSGAGVSGTVTTKLTIETIQDTGGGGPVPADIDFYVLLTSYN